MIDKKKFHPSYLKTIIEKIELIPSNKLGIVLTQNNMGFTNLYFYKESFEMFDEATIEQITAIFQYFEHMITIYKHESELCGKDSSKRFILDYLNINHLMYTGRPELKDLMNVTKLMFKYYSSPLEDLYISKTVKSVIIKNVTVKEYNKKVEMEKSKKIASTLAQKLLTNETKKEYDFTKLSNFNKNFKPYKFTYE
jgi:hypothetical protein